MHFHRDIGRRSVWIDFVPPSGWVGIVQDWDTGETLHRTEPQTGNTLALRLAEDWCVANPQKKAEGAKADGDGPALLEHQGAGGEAGAEPEPAADR